MICNFSDLFHDQVQTVDVTTSTNDVDINHFWMSPLLLIKMFPDLDHFLHVGVEISLLNLRASLGLGNVWFIIKFYRWYRNGLVPLVMPCLLAGVVPGMRIVTKCLIYVCALWLELSYLCILSSILTQSRLLRRSEHTSLTLTPAMPVIFWGVMSI